MLINNKDLIFIIIIIILLVFNIYQYYINEKISSKEILKNNNNNNNDPFLKDNIFTIDVRKLSENHAREIYMSCLVGRIPLKIKNGIDLFPIIKDRWNKEYINKKYSTQKKKYVIVGTHNKKDSFIDSWVKQFNIRDRKNMNNIHKSKKNEFLLDADPNLYLDSNYSKYTKTNPNNNMFRREVGTSNIKPRIIDDIIPNLLFGPNNVQSFIIYNGPKNTGVLPHGHGDSLNILKTGKKKWIFCSKDLIASKGHFRLCDELAIENCKKDRNLHKINWMTWYKNYKNLKYGDDIECIQESGDVILVPRERKHTVYNIEDGLGTVIDLRPYSPENLKPKVDGPKNLKPESQ